MCASPLRFLRAGPPPPRVALLPDALFFTRSVPIAKGAVQAEAAGQVELALESVSPFPLAQLFYGWFWVAGSERALVFASYRRRFTSDQTATWEGAELVLPSFAAVLGAEVGPATTILLNSLDGLTAVHWDEPPVPSKVIHRAIGVEATDDDRAKLREEILREVGGSKKVIELEAPLTADPSATDRELVFRSGDFVARVAASTAAALDVRDKGELADLRNARKRDVVLWRVALGAAAALLLLAVGEFALMGGRAWQQVRMRQYNAQKPLVDKIAKVHELTNRIEDLQTKRLLPLEMVTQIVGENNERVPPDILFTRMHTEQSQGLYTLVVDAKTQNPPQINAYEAAVKNLPSVQSAVVSNIQTTGSSASFRLTVTFKPEALKPTATTVASSR
jgi:hypothetical protein